jgi:hypothetical protein
MGYMSSRKPEQEIFLNGGLVFNLEEASYHRRRPFHCLFYPMYISTHCTVYQSRPEITVKYKCEDILLV